MKSIIDQMQKDADSQGNGESPYLSLKDKDQFRIRFLQELSEAAPGHSETRGIAAYIQIHQSPANFKKQAQCTKKSEGKCYGCEQYEARATKESGRWKSKGRLYVNVLVKTSDGDKVKVLQQSMSPKHVALTLLEFASEYGSITDRDYKIKRTGTDMSNTSYSLTPLDTSPLPDDVDKLTLHDLTKMVKVVPYDEQDGFYNETAETSESAGW